MKIPETWEQKKRRWAYFGAKKKVCPNCKLRLCICQTTIGDFEKK